MRTHTFMNTLTHTHMYTVRGFKTRHAYVSAKGWQMPSFLKLSLCGCYYAYLCMFVCMCACMHVYVCVGGWVHACVDVCVCVCVCVYVCMCTVLLGIISCMIMVFLIILLQWQQILLCTSQNTKMYYFVGKPCMYAVRQNYWMMRCVEIIKMYISRSQ